MTATSLDLGRPIAGDVIELILDDHFRFEALLRQLRNSSSDRDAVRKAFAAVHVAHAEAEEKYVYPKLLAQRAIGNQAEHHGEEEHAEGNAALLAVLEADVAETKAFDDAVEELSRLVNHHLAEEELTILNPARMDVPETLRASLGQEFAKERNAQIDADCGRVENVRDLVGRAKARGLLEHPEFERA